MQNIDTTQPSPAPERCIRTSKKALIATLPLVLALPTAATAQLYWGDTAYTGTSSTASSWYTDAAGNTASATAPNGEDLIFNTTPGNGSGGDIIVDTDFSANSLTFNTSGNTRLVQSGTRALDLGTGGITLGASSGSVTIGTGNFLNTNITGSQTWSNNSSSNLTVRSLSTASGAGAVTLNLDLTGTGNITFSQPISDSASDPLALVVNASSSGYVSVTQSSNSIRGGTTINQGLLFTYGNLGGAVQLGDTSGSGNASLTVRNTTSFNSDITVRSGSSGTKKLTTHNSNLAFSGSLTLNDDLSIVTNTSTSGTFNGAISGDGNIVKTGNGALIFAGVNTSTGDLTIDVGSFTLSSTGSMEFTIGANGVNNQINGISTSIAFDGTFIFDLTGAELIDGNTWTIVGSDFATYGLTFDIDGFVENNGIWTKDGFTFSESTGQLAYAVPEPSMAALILGSAALFLVGKRRRQSRA